MSSNDQHKNYKRHHELSLAVVIPTIGHSRHLYSAFHSVFDQLLLPDEIIVVWNGCIVPDWFDCVERSALALKVPIIQVQHKEQVDISISWTSGAHASTADLLLFLGDDDLIDPDFISLAQETFEAHQGLDVFATNVRYIDNLGHLMNVPCLQHQLESRIHFVNQESYWFGAPPPIFASVFTRKKLETIGFFPYFGFAFDVWMFHHLAMVDGYCLFYLHKPKVSYRRSGVSSSNQIFKHSLSYAVGLLEFQRIFELSKDIKSFRAVAANFALTAIAKNLNKPLSAIRFCSDIAFMGFGPDLVAAIYSRCFSRVVSSFKRFST